MSEFFGWFSSVVMFLQSWKIIGDLSVWSIFLTCLVGTIIIKLLKGVKTNNEK